MDASRQQQIESKLAHLERHIAAQDNEIYLLSRRVDQLNQAISKLNLKYQSLTSGGGDTMPANEKPPHY